MLASCLLACVPLVPFGPLVADVHVDRNAPDCGSGTGTATDPVCDLAAALALASPGDRIVFAPGQYAGAVALPFDLELVGTEGEAVTALVGTPTASCVLHVLADTSVTIEGLSIRNGGGVFASGVDVFGAGIRVWGNGRLTLRNSTISHNHAVGYGASGGGIFAEYNGPSANGPKVRLENCTVHKNTVDQYTYYGAGAGGGIYVRGGELTIYDSTISENVAIGVYGAFGGGIAVVGGTLTVRNSTISGNAVSGPSFLYQGGGGISAGGGAMVIANSTISGNAAANGSGIAVGGDPSLSILSSTTITRNVGRSAAWTGSVGGIPIANSIVAGNLGLVGAEEARGGFLSLGHNLIGAGGPAFTHGLLGDQVGSPSAPIAPLLGPLQDAGGPAHTHPLLPGSPALDSGGTVLLETADQRGLPRPSGAAQDIGAVEGGGSGADYCIGDGGDQGGCTDCPCGNNAPAGSGGGCLNSSGTGARLHASGSPSVSLPVSIPGDLRLALTGAPPHSHALLVSGETIAPENAAHPCHGLNRGATSQVYDGLRCAVRDYRRHGARAVDANGAVGTTTPPWGGEHEPLPGLAQALDGFAAGQLRYFQVVFREDPQTVCLRGLSTSQAIGVVFSP